MTSSESTHLPLREMADLGGVSGGPMISLITGKVHGGAQYERRRLRSVL